MTDDPLNSQRKNPQGRDGREPSYFISYSHQDREAVEKIRRGIQKGSQRFHIWFDEGIEPGDLFAPKIQKEIAECSAMLFLASRSSVESPFCLKEINLAENKGKKIVPLRLHSEVELPEGNLPLQIQGVQYIDFSTNFEGGLKALCAFLARERQNSPPPPVTTEPVAVKTLPSVTTGLVVINDPPLIAPTYFQGRDKLCRTIEEFLSDDTRALLWISGRAGSGKTALACRVLEKVRLGVWADPDRRVDINAIAYIGQKQQSRADWRKLFDELCYLIAKKSEAVLPKSRQGCSQPFEVQNVLTNLANRRIVLLIDHLDDLIDFKTRTMRGQYLRDALQTVLTVTAHRLKVIVTSCMHPLDFSRGYEGRWVPIDLGNGLPASEATQLLKALDQGGTFGIRDSDERSLGKICQRAMGNPRAIEALHALLRDDRSASTKSILEDRNRFLPEEVSRVLIGESYARLDDVSKTMIQILSVSKSSVTANGVVIAEIFHHYYPTIDPQQVLKQLANLQLVKKRNECYVLRVADRWYVTSQLAGGKSSTEVDPEGVHLSRSMLYKRQAEYIQQAVSTSDRAAIAEFHCCCKGEDYAAAVDVLKRLETPLFVKKRYQRLAQCYKGLGGKLEDPKLVRHRLDTLARIYHRLGALDLAAEKYEEGLKCMRDAGDQNGECRYLANLAICKQESGDLVRTTLYCMAALELARQTGDGASREAHIWNIIGETLASLGQISAAIKASQRALKLARDKVAQEIQVVALFNLGQYYEALDNGNQAEDECNRACRIAQSSGFQLGESAAMRNLGSLNVSRGKYQRASKDLAEAIRLADVTQNVQLQQTTRIELATALLLGDRVCEAEATVDEAVQYDMPLFNPEAHALRGVIRKRQGKMREAAESFSQALKQAEVVLNRTPPYYRGLDAMGLSYSGLALSEQADEYLDEAIGAYGAAHDITNEPGIVHRRLLLFDALAKDDSEKKLALVRNAITPAP